MKEKGIIMSGDHPAKVLDETKTMTRRTWGLSLVNDPPQSMANWQKIAVFQDGSVRFATPDGNGDVTLVCPYGGVGDRLWVREGYCIGNNKRGEYANIIYKSACEPFYLRVDWNEWLEKEVNKGGYISKWRPSIHMPRWASRINLEITEVRVERVQEITEEDCIVEGCPHALMMLPTVPMQKWYEHLWDSLNAKRGYGWSANPWVWVVSFRRIDGNH